MGDASSKWASGAMGKTKLNGETGSERFICKRLLHTACGERRIPTAREKRSRHCQSSVQGDMSVEKVAEEMNRMMMKRFEKRKASEQSVVGRKRGTMLMVRHKRRAKKT